MKWKNQVTANVAVKTEINPLSSFSHHASTWFYAALEPNPRPYSTPNFLIFKDRKAYVNIMRLCHQLNLQLTDFYEPAKTYYLWRLLRWR